MAFTFQINKDVNFHTDEKLLKKANDLHPVLHKKKIHAVSIVTLTQDQSKLHHVGVKPLHHDIQNLKKIALKRDERIILDFEDHFVGTFHINIDSVGSPMDAPLYIRLRFAEVASELAQESSSYDGWLSKSWIQEEYVHIDELPSMLSLPRRYSFRFVEIYVIDTSPKWQATFENPYVMYETSANMDAFTPSKFIDKELQSIYDVSVKTLADCMQDVFEDGPKRDRRLWLGDLRLQALANYATFDNQDLVKRCLYLFAAMRCNDGKIVANVFVKPKDTPDDTFLFDYSLFFISTLHDYYIRYQDNTMLDELYDIAKKQIDIACSYVTSKGKLELNEDYPVFVDWSNEFDKECAAQGIMIYALKQFIELCNIRKDTTKEIYEKQLENMIAYTKQNLYDNEHHVFVSGKDHEVNIASQVWMVLANILTPSENKEVMKHCCDVLFPITGIATPYMYHHVVEALCVADLKEDAIALMKGYWGKMIALGADTYWEAFDPNEPSYSPYGSAIISSYCHAWSCTPAYILETYMKK